jgi:hypothetical protein
MTRIDPSRLADWFVEQMRKPPDPDAEAEQAAFEAEKAALLHVWHVRKGRKPATARTRAEMEFAASLEPCPTCGGRGLAATSLTGSNDSWQLAGACASCGTTRQFTFSAQGDPTRETHAADELSRLPSFLIPAETFQAELERLVPLAASDPEARQRALVCMNELVKLADPHERDARRAELFALVRAA